MVIKVWLKLLWFWIGAIVTILKEKGYFLGGILPQWFGDDGLLMQKIPIPPNWNGINLYSEQAQKILEFVKSDWQK